MRETRLSFPELALVAGTRAVLGAGLALLLGNRLAAGDRKLLGWTLVALGAATTIPLGIDLLAKSRSVEPAW